jgi:hypothetical protein
MEIKEPLVLLMALLMSLWFESAGLRQEATAGSSSGMVNPLQATSANPRSHPEPVGGSNAVSIRSTIFPHSKTSTKGFAFLLKLFFAPVSAL